MLRFDYVYFPSPHTSFLRFHIIPSDRITTPAYLFCFPLSLQSYHCSSSSSQDTSSFLVSRINEISNTSYLLFIIGSTHGHGTKFQWNLPVLPSTPYSASLPAHYFGYTLPYMFILFRCAFHSRPPTIE